MPAADAGATDNVTGQANLPDPPYVIGPWNDRDSEDRTGAVIQRRVEPGVFLVGRRNLQAAVSLRLLSERTGEAILSTTSVGFGAQVDPSRTFTRFGIEGTLGEKEGGFEGSALFTYKINWQTAVYVGYGDERAIDERDDLRQTSRQLFAKVSYAFQR